MSTDLTLKNLGDHPRVCGEHELTLFENGLALGSSPRVRGTRETAHVDVPEARIIPACAGNTKDNGGVTAENRDHPRVCGEHYAGIVSYGAIVGIIPACAGNTGLAT